MSALWLHRYRPVALLMLVLHLGACTTWGPVTVNPRQFIEEERPARIRVWQDERATELRNPVIDGDTIGSTIVPRTLPRIALTDITSIEARRPSSVRTLALTLGVVGAIIVVVLGATYECC